MQRIAQFWKSGTKGKLVIGCSGVLAILCLCALSTLLLPEDSTQQAGEEPTATQVIAEAKPTNTPEPTETPAPTNTPRPTDTPRSTDTAIPTATLTPEPTRELSDITFLEIVEQFEQCIEGQQWGPTQEWDSYVESILGECVEWFGWYEFAVDEKTYYRVGMRMESPNRYGIENARVDLILPYDVRERLEALDSGQQITFQGEIVDVVTAFTTFDCVYLDNVIFVE